MGSKRTASKAKRKWEQQVGPALAASKVIERYRDSLKQRFLSSDSEYRLIGKSIDTWKTQGKATYLVDANILEELMGTALPDGEVPHEVFRRRPHESALFVFADPLVEKIGVIGEEKPTALNFNGFVISNDLGTDGYKNLVPAIRFTFCGEDPFNKRTMSISFTVPTGEFWQKVPNSENEFVQLSTASAVDLVALHNFDENLVKENGYKTVDGVGQNWESLSDLFKLALNLMMYVSAAEPDLVAIPEPVFGGRRVAPAHSPVVHHLGFRVGAALRSASAAAGTNTVSGRAIAPHLRRAHWHRYWTGPMQGERKLKVRWVSQTLVAADKGEYIPAVRPIAS